jgi:mannitol/fructose-specific phosphotransferase system IIA component (Ntr-type)
MINVIREIGPYVVIAPGIALLHARPEDGVIKTCFGITTLKDPVAFGHSQNDPVDLVLVLGAVDKTSHIQALQQIATFLGYPANLEKLREAQDDDELFSIIQSGAAD